jgi:hydrogenase-4 component A
MTRFIYANPSLCTGCDACVDACLESHKAQGLAEQARITIVRTEDRSAPVVCRQCENAPCAAVCPTNAIVIGKNAIELDEEKCIGCKFCVIVCPFGAIALAMPGTQARGAAVPLVAAAKAEENMAALGMNAGAPKTTGKIAAKCDLCETAAEGPSCLKVCPTKAIFLVDDKTMRRAVTAKRSAAVRNMPFMENPNAKKA